MAEYKQYITQIQENGNVMISENVVLLNLGDVLLVFSHFVYLLNILMR